MGDRVTNIVGLDVAFRWFGRLPWWHIGVVLEFLWNTQESYWAIFWIDLVIVKRLPWTFLGLCWGGFKLMVDEILRAVCRRPESLNMWTLCLVEFWTLQCSAEQRAHTLSSHRYMDMWSIDF